MSKKKKEILSRQSDRYISIYTKIYIYISTYALYFKSISWFFLLMFTQYKAQVPLKVDGSCVVLY